MKRFVKMLTVTCVAALALAAVAAAGAQAAQIHSKRNRHLTGTQTSDQVFTTNAGGKENVTCKKAHTTGEIIAT